MERQLAGFGDHYQSLMVWRGLYRSEVPGESRATRTKVLLGDDWLGAAGIGNDKRASG